MSFISDLSKPVILPNPSLGLLPAVHDATVVDWTSSTTFPDPVVNANNVWKNATSGPITLPAQNSWPAQVIGPNEFFASNGALLYPVFRNDASNSYYPTAFERTIFTIALSPHTLPLRSRFELERQVQVRMFSNNVDCTWILQIEIGEVVSESTPPPTGPNISHYSWRAPLFRQAFLITDVLQTSRVGVELWRDIEGATEKWLGNVIISGKKIAALPSQLPTNAEGLCALRWKWTCFDAADAPRDARGYVAYLLSEPEKEEK